MNQINYIMNLKKIILMKKRIVDLLKKGSNPLGNMSSNSDYKEPYEEIVYENKNQDKITKIL